jgi:4-diphosphocytidyl-2-C-methyl-D-erythritol kinase
LAAPATGPGFAPAKINLFLHVGPPGADGYHPICSLMVFADVGDQLTLRPAPHMRLTVEGPFAADLSGEADNLVVRARDALMAQGSPDAAFELVLHKALPIASGLGGGSSDAAAAMRLVHAALGLDLDRDALAQIAARLGSDVPACLSGAPATATGRGEVLRAAPALPVLDAVLVNPMVSSPTGEVYRAFDAAPATADPPRPPARLDTALEVARFLAACRNDLEGPAIGLRPRIGEVLASLAGQPETLLARMSGSGATCFALCADAVAAGRLEQRLGAAERGWWVRRCRLGGPW